MAIHITNIRDKTEVTPYIITIFGSTYSVYARLRNEVSPEQYLEFQIVVEHFKNGRW